MAAYLDPSQGLGPATDYQGALATALRLLESDMVESGVAVRARTRYIVTFISDGALSLDVDLAVKMTELVVEMELIMMVMDSST